MNKNNQDVKLNENTVNTTDFQQLGSVNSIIETLSYQSDPLAVYHTLCNEKHNQSSGSVKDSLKSSLKGSLKENTLLLESAEIDKKHQLKSLLLVDTAVKIVCDGNKVTFSALTNNGENALAFAQQALSTCADITAQSNEQNTNSDKSTLTAFTANFPDVNQQLDEHSRLLASNPFQSLRVFQQLDNLSAHPFSVFLGGALAFDMMAVSEKLPEVSDSDNTCPDFVFYLAETLIVIDHEKQSSELIVNLFSGANHEDNKTALSARIDSIKTTLASNITATLTPKAAAITESSPKAVKTDISDTEFCQIVNDLKENILAGDIFQVVPSRTFSLPCSNTLNAYKALKHSNPSPYMFYLQDSDFCIFGASPESSLKYIESNRHVEIYPIAGTRPRGFNNDGSLSPDLDSRLELDLRLDKKELAEHIMLVDLARNDIARVSQPGTRHVADLLKVDRYSHVMHLVSRVCGTLEHELDALHAYQACMNMGTLSGAPKVKATSLIRQVEGKRRGSYGGAVGYITGEGDMDTCIVIRSAFVSNQVAHIQAGAGVVFDSDPQSEANETRQKAQAVINAVNNAENKELIVSTAESNKSQESSAQEVQS